ncbi:MAG: hypothetical protein N2170_07780 [Bacteroidia bacterium]|nr:hypothetical protein [Bacteroidia bacterium]
MREVLYVFIGGGLYVSFQAGVVPLIEVSDIAWPMPYVLFWLTLPFHWNKGLSLSFAAGFGVLMDLLFPPHGLQTFCGLWIWGLRRWWIQLFNPNLPSEWEKDFSVSSLAPGEFFFYAFPLTFWHHTLYFTLAKWSLSVEVVLQIVLSSAYTFLWEWLIFELVLRRRHVRA